jgi:hypothetical protein
VATGTGAGARRRRAIEVLEYAGTEAGKMWLEESSQSFSGTFLAREANPASERIRKKMPGDIR